jgi:hypothetical protein
MTRYKPLSLWSRRFAAGLFFIVAALTIATEAQPLGMANAPVTSADSADANVVWGVDGVWCPLAHCTQFDTSFQNVTPLPSLSKGLAHKVCKYPCDPPLVVEEGVRMLIASKQELHPSSREWTQLLAPLACHQRGTAESFYQMYLVRPSLYARREHPYSRRLPCCEIILAGCSFVRNVRVHQGQARPLYITPGR